MTGRRLGTLAALGAALYPLNKRNYAQSGIYEELKWPEGTRTKIHKEENT